MPEQHRTSGAPTTLRVESRHARFLRRHFCAGVGGYLEALTKHSERIGDPNRMRSDVKTLERIIDGINRGEIVADAEVRAMLIEQALISDDAIAYEEVVREHEAFAHLLRQLGPHGEDDNHDPASQVRHQRLLLRELLAPPAYGGFVAELARAIEATAPATEAVAAALADKGLATVKDGYIAATGAAIDFWELSPSRY